MKRFIFVFAAILAVQGCSRSPLPHGISVVSSIEPISYIAGKILQERGSSVPLLTENQDAHSADPRPLSLKAAENCDLLVLLKSGLEFEERNAPAVIGAAKKAVVLKLTDSIVSSEDPHIWVSLRNLKRIAEMLAEKISLLDPDNKEFYASNFLSYASRIDSVSARLSFSLEEAGVKRIFTDHTAFSYFASEAGIEQVELFEEGKEPSLADMKRITEGLKKDNARILIITSPSSKRYADIFAEEASARVFFFNPLAKDIVGEFSRMADFIHEGSRNALSK